MLFELQFETVKIVLLTGHPEQTGPLLLGGEKWNTNPGAKGNSYLIPGCNNQRSYEMLRLEFGDLLRSLASLKHS